MNVYEIILKQSHRRNYHCKKKTKRKGEQRLLAIILEVHMAII